VTCAGTIIAIMLLMYARLYFVLYRAHTHFLSIDIESSSAATTADPTIRNINADNQPRVLAKDNSFGENNQRPSTNAKLSRSSRKIRRLARLMLLYPLAYAVIWTLPTSIRIYQTVTSRSAPWQLQTVDKACIVIQGFVDAVIYGVNESSLSSWRNVLFPRQFPTVEGMTPAGGGGGPDATDDKSARGWPNGGTNGASLTSSGARDRTSRGMGGDSDPALTGADSLDSLEIGYGSPTGCGYGDKVELGELKRHGASMGIRKMVDFDMPTSDGRSHASRTSPMPSPPQPSIKERSFLYQ
jgi:hypothetical protein